MPEPGQPPPQGHNFHELQPVLLVRDVDASVAHYSGVLGFEVLERIDTAGMPHYARLRRDKVTLRLERDDRGARHGPPSAYFYIHLGHADGSEDMDGLFAECRAKAARVTMEPRVQPWGLREFEVEDPDGHALRFAVDARPYVLTAAGDGS